MTIVTVIKPRLIMAFNMSEHICAVGYATSEFAFEHSKLILDISSGVLLAVLALIGFCKLTEHYDRLFAGYRARDLDETNL